MCCEYTSLTVALCARAIPAAASWPSFMPKSTHLEANRCPPQRPPRPRALTALPARQSRLCLAQRSLPARARASCRLLLAAERHRISLLRLRLRQVISLILRPPPAHAATAPARRARPRAGARLREFGRRDADAARDVVEVCELQQLARHGVACHLGATDLHAGFRV